MGALKNCRAYGIAASTTLVMLAGSSAFAQHATPSEATRAAILSSRVVSNFESRYGIPVVLESKPIDAQVADTDPYSARLRDLELVTQNAGATWRKVYRIVPASTSAPVTTYAMAQKLVDEDGPINMSVQSAPAAGIDLAIARADHAEVRFPDGAPTARVTLTLKDATTAEAIAAMAAATQTHWHAVYYVAPAMPQPQPVSVSIASSAGLMNANASSSEESGNQPIVWLWQTYPSQTTPSSTPASASNVQRAQPSASQTAAPAAEPYPYATPMTPAVVNNPYGYSGLEYAPNYYFGGSQVINPFASP